MGVNAGRFHGVGQRVTSATFLGQVSIKPPAEFRSVTPLLLQAPGPSGTIIQLFQVFNSSGQLVMSIPNAGGFQTIGGNLMAGTAAKGFFGFDGSTNPTSIKAPNGTRWYIGSGTMGIVNYPHLNGNVGDIYCKVGSASPVLQQCTVAGNPGTWTTIAS